MKNKVLYVHGQGGNASEAEHFHPLFPDCEVIGLDYRAETPWEAKEEFLPKIGALCGDDPFTLIANSIGAFFALSALPDRRVGCAYLISPVTDMENLILGMMRSAGVTEEELREKGTLDIGTGQPLSMEYLTYVRKNPIVWNAPTQILYGSRDALIPPETVRAFAQRTGAALTVMEGGEHWFHTAEQMDFLDRWILSSRREKKIKKEIPARNRAKEENQ